VQEHPSIKVSAAQRRCYLSASIFCSVSRAVAKGSIANEILAVGRLLRLAQASSPSLIDDGIRS
jgi:hypothetical protein